MTFLIGFICGGVVTAVIAIVTAVFIMEDMDEVNNE